MADCSAKNETDDVSFCRLLSNRYFDVCRRAGCLGDSRQMISHCRLLSQRGNRSCGRLLIDITMCVVMPIASPTCWQTMSPMADRSARKKWTIDVFYCRLVSHRNVNACRMARDVCGLLSWSVLSMVCGQQMHCVADCSANA